MKKGVKKKVVSKGKKSSVKKKPKPISKTTRTKKTIITKNTNQGYFSLLSSNFKKIDKKFFKLIGYEMIFFFIFMLSYTLFWSGMVSSLQEFQPLNQEELLQDPALLSAIDINPWGLIGKVVLLFVVIFAISLLNYSLVRGTQYQKILFGKVDQKINKKFLIFNLVWWIMTLVLLLFLSFIIVFSYLMGTVIGSFVVFNAMVVMLLFLIILVSTYLKIIANIHFFTDGKIEPKKILSTAIRIHYFIPFLIMLEVIWVIIVSIFPQHKWVALLLFIIYYLFAITLTRNFFIDLVKKIHAHQ